MRAYGRLRKNWVRDIAGEQPSDTAPALQNSQPWNPLIILWRSEKIWNVLCICESTVCRYYRLISGLGSQFEEASQRVSEQLDMLKGLSIYGKKAGLLSTFLPILPVGICILPDSHLPSCFSSSCPGNSYPFRPLVLRTKCVWTGQVVDTVTQWQTQTSLQGWEVRMIKFHNWKSALIFSRCCAMVLFLTFRSFVFLSFPLVWPWRFLIPQHACCHRTIQERELASHFSSFRAFAQKQGVWDIFASHSGAQRSLVLRS